MYIFQLKYDLAYAAKSKTSQFCDIVDLLIVYFGKKRKERIALK